MKISITSVISILLLAFFLAQANNDLKRVVGPQVEFDKYPFVVSIVAMPNATSISSSCTGSILQMKDDSTFILTTAFCIDVDESLTLKVLVEHPSGEVELNGNKFKEFPVQQKFIQEASTNCKTTSFTLNSELQDGTPINLESVPVCTNDVGILKLKGLVSAEVSSAIPVKLSSDIPALANTIKFLGYGGPDFFTLKESQNSVSLNSTKTGGDGNSEAIFIRDDRVNVPANETEAVEVGDEGGPMLNQDGEQVGIIQGSFFVEGGNMNLNGTLSSVGPSIAHNFEWIQSIITPAKPAASSHMGSPSLLMSVLALALAPVLIVV